MQRWRSLWKSKIRDYGDGRRESLVAHKALDMGGGCAVIKQ